MSKGRVLVVDDEPEIRQAVRLTLFKAGYEVIVAEDGEKGIAAIQSGSNPKKVDAIVCDLYMPKVNGMEAILYFRSHFPTVPVIVITGQSEIAKTNALSDHVAKCLLKPFEPEELTAAVDKVVNKR